MGLHPTFSYSDSGLRLRSILPPPLPITLLLLASHFFTHHSSRNQSTMIRLFILSSVLTSFDAFRLAPPSPLSTMMATTSSPALQRCRASSPLRAAAAAAGDDGAAAAEGGIPEETKASSDDILNSPAFLNRKVEVLQSDIAALEKELEEANAVASAAKVEWGTKFDMLNKEVSEALISAMHYYHRCRQHHVSSRHLLMPILHHALISRKGCRSDWTSRER